MCINIPASFAEIIYRSVQTGQGKAKNIFKGYHCILYTRSKNITHDAKILYFKSLAPDPYYTQEAFIDVESLSPF